MRVTTLCKERSIRAAERTPLLVPSFSSRGFPALSALHATLYPYISDVSLVSAFDINHGYLTDNAAYASDIVFIDSGGYEARNVYDPLDAYHDEREARSWCDTSYRRVLSALRPYSTLIIVSFDQPPFPALDRQIAQAHDLFQEFPQFRHDFLLKPPHHSHIVGDAKALKTHCSSLSTFDLLGITDKELGTSLIERCRKIAEIRTVLDSLGISLPIHIFGALDPLSCVLFYMCGADVFDGLSWLRYDFCGNIASYIQQTAILRGAGNLTDEELMAYVCVENLQIMRDLQRSMNSFAHDYEPSKLPFTTGQWDHITGVLSQASISFAGVR